jgi:serine/threonine protein phosphatase PrpC
MKYQLATTCRLGNRKSNQDRFSVVETGDAVFLVVADGMSGHSEGKLAADTLVDSLLRSFNSCRFPHPAPHKFLSQILAIAHKEVLAAGARHSPPVTPRTTCVVCLVQEGTAIWAHVGDSRLYWIRRGEILEHTIDHSRVEELYRQGLITAEQKFRHPQRNIVTQCIGSPKKPPKPTISQKTPLSSDDILLLCSDGLWGQLPEERLAVGIADGDIEEALEKLAHDAELNSFPKSDNISAVAFHWLSNEKTRSTAYKPLSDDLDDLSDGLDAIIKTLDEIEKDID